ncbi:hypothetical protein [Pseudarthrobacter oxydans]|uniref:hypothetical protein n=1 Tax=Pseudarthrobacter oxydans TaxID=1671 RepID=UPI0037F5B7CF
MNQEHPDEARAKQIVERVLAIQLEHADTHGGVDYISTDGTVALEVTAVTDGAIKAARDALSKAKAKGKGSPTTRLKGCWWVFASDTAPRMKTFSQRVQSAIAELELAGQTSFDRRAAERHVEEGGDLSHVYLPLVEAGAERAVPFPCPNLEEDPDHVHRIRDSSGRGGGATIGSNESIGLLVKELNTKPDNPAKLRDSGAEQRHLFVWLDDDTEYNIARPLSHESPSGANEGCGLPTANPQLDLAITDLWVVHARSLLGWLWDGEKWRELRNP